MEMETEGLNLQLSKKLEQNEVNVTKGIGSSSSASGSTPESVVLDNNNADHSGHEDGGGEDDMMDDGDDVFDEDVDDNDDGDDYEYMLDYDDGNVEEDDDDYLSMQAQFDNVDLPPGVEASVSWLKDCTSTSTATPASKLCSSSHTAGVGTLTGASVLNGSVGPSSNANGKAENVDSSDVIRKYQNFKRFDTIEDFTDHHYSNMTVKGQQPPKAWSKKIQDEWKILEKDLPDTIYVRVSETRMDLLRAVIVGPQGTPYHDGLFVFDAFFPAAYPDTPPMFFYYSGGVRLNPNLYDCGKVCLSLLNTWTGKGSEKWLPKQSTMLQVLVSIQALILNAKPFFNEPGYETSYAGAEGERRSKDYNENVFILSLKTMTYTLRRPPRHFEDLVTGHFHLRAHQILSACKAYWEGALVGSGPQGKREGKTGREFKDAVAKVTNGLVATLAKSGVKDCEQFRLSS